MKLPDFAECLPELRRRGLLPERFRAAYIAGSIARGWGHAASDLDVYIICDEPWTGEVTTRVPVALTPDTVPFAVAHVDKMRWTVEYWQDAQIDQLLDKVSWAVFEHDPKSAELVTSPIQKELNILERMNHAIVLAGEEWIEERRRQIGESAIRSLAASAQLDVVDTYTEDVAGLIESGDFEAAVLSAHLAFQFAVDALMAFHGEVARDGKWRSRRVRIVDSKILPFDAYWRLETMQDLDPEDPLPWLQSVLALCREISFEVVL
ncbi:hypothetical protein AB0K51_04505 [Kitasatospora sp. NPDC049285]|uniref:hypothetical protein n=1 Tax=Kitasatospora sp. NPDC049285 TaxID=3157096 RepID=UPI003448C020